MNKSYIDKLALVEIRNKKILVTLSKGKDTWYIPGGKREKDETDEQALMREVKEELDVEIIPSSIQKYSVFEAQAHGKPVGTIIRMTCFTANHNGTLKPSAEIEKLDYLSYDQKFLTSPVDHLIMDDLKKKGLIE
jgi:ADP-ribose pyrophosphatase YjhB (NUDIX family)